MIAAAIGSLCAVVMWAAPKAMDAWDAQERIKNYEVELEDTNLKLALLQDYEQTDLRNRLENTLLVTLPKEFDVPLVIKALNQVMKELDMEIVEAAAVDTSGQSGGPQKGPAVKLQEQHITMTVKGGVIAFKDLLAKIEEIAPILKVRSISMATLQEEEGIQAEIEVHTFAMALETVRPDTVDKSQIPVFDAADEVLFEKLTKLRKLDPTQFEEASGSADRNPFEFQ